MIKYIFAYEPNTKLGSGMVTKIDGQVKALNNMGILTLKEGHYKPSKIYRIIPFNTSSINWNEVDINNIDGLYIRYLMSDFKFLKLLRKAKKKNKTVCLEMPTYPYQKELDWYNLKTIRDYIYRKHLYKYVDHIFYIGCNKRIDKIFGIDCERISNGIDFDTIPVCKHIPSSNSIRLIAVGDLQKSHGYERIIKGISKYYSEGGDRNIVFTIVGDGYERQFYEDLSSELHITDHVKFTGYLTDDDLDNAYNNADIGVEVFGLFKRGINISSSLKSREYLARGIPFICGVKNDIIDKDFPYCLFFPNNESIVNIVDVINFYDRIYSKNLNSEIISTTIREYSKKIASWETTMKPVFEYFRLNVPTTHL